MINTAPPVATQGTKEQRVRYAVAFTQTCPIMNETYVRQYMQTWPVIKRVLDKIGKYEVYPELTLNGMIHYHGKIAVDDKYEYYKGIKELRRKLGYNLFKAIDNEEKWDKYIEKDKGTMLKILNSQIEELPITGDRIIKLENKDETSFKEGESSVA